jgi:MFS transporter, DHA1 family, multidrug resistance protein
VEGSVLLELSPTKDQRLNYRILIVSLVSLQITSSTIFMVLPVFFQECGINNSGVGILISIGTFGGVISGIIAGKLSDIYGRKPFLLLGGLLYAIVFFSFSFLDKVFWNFFMLRFLEGFAYFMIPVMVVSMAADIFPPMERGRAMAYLSISSGIGQLIGPLFAGYFLEASDFITYFVFCGIFSLISLSIIFFYVKETLDKSTIKPDPAPKRKRAGGGVRRFFIQTKNLGKVFLIFLGATTIYRFGYTMMDPLFSLYLKNILHLNMSSISYLFAVRAVCTILFAPLCGYMADKVGRKPTFLTGIAISGITMIGYGMVTSYEYVLIVRVFDSISTVTLLTVIRTMMADLVRPDLRGFGQGLYSSISQESSTMGAIVGGVITDIWGFNGVFLMASAGSVLALLIVQLWVPEPSKYRTERDGLMQ